MRQLAMVVAAFLVLAVISPAFAQPFADTPTNHWAYDAIAELAAKGLIEGYPDGTFKGDRAMTRYEMAMVVARLLARIESIQIPTPQAVPQPCRSGVVSNPSLQASTQPQAQAQPAQAPAGPPCYVTRADIDMILRLVNEFRAELAAKNVRLTAVEEELNAIKAKLDNVRITGRFRFRYDNSSSVICGTLAAPVACTPATSLNGNVNVGTVHTTAYIFRAREGFKLALDGSVSPNVHLIAGIEVASDASSTPLTFNSGNFGQTNGNPANGPIYIFSNIAELFFDWKNIFGWPLELWLGRFGTGQQGFASYPVQFGPFGLLLNTTSTQYGASTSGANNTATTEIDGLRLAGHFAQAADLQIQGLIWRVAGQTGGTSYELGEDAYGVDANIQVIPGLRVGGYYVGNAIPAAGSTITPGAPSSLYHVYGNPGTPSQNPVTNFTGLTTVPGCLPSGAGATTPGITCPAAGNGYGAYLGWDVLPGIHLDLEAAQWNDTSRATTTSDSGAYANVTWDLGTLTGIGHKLTLGTGYEYLGTNFYPPYGNTSDDFISGSLFPGNTQGLRATIDFEFIPGLNFHGAYFTGNNVSNSMSAVDYHAGLLWSFAPGATVYLRYEYQSQGGVQQESGYRLEMNYTF